MLLACAAAVAAPLESAPAPPGVAADEADRAAVPLERQTLPEVPSASRTIDLLLEMQGKNPGLAAGNERPAGETPDPERARALRRAVLGDTELQESAIKGPAAARASDAAMRPVDAVDDDGAAFNPIAGPRELPAGGSADQDTVAARRIDEIAGLAADPPRTSQAGGERRWLIPPGFILFLRENRDYVIGGCVIALIALGVASARASRHRRR